MAKPNAYALIQLLAQVAILGQLPFMCKPRINIGDAVGVQLDVIGKYCGVTRNGYGTNGPITLGDADFRLLIQLAVIKNNSGTSMGAIETALNNYFNGAITISDSTNMSLNYAIVNTFGSSDLQNMIVYEGLLPRPMGVGISVSIVPPGGNHFFTFSTYAAPAPAGTSPFNDYTFYNFHYPWITY